MLLPRFTVRTGLFALTAAALLSLVVREAWVGSPWAVGATISLVGVAGLFGIHALFFFLAIGLSRGRQEVGPAEGDA